jgi:hypothetical protein
MPAELSKASMVHVRNAQVGPATSKSRMVRVSDGRAAQQAGRFGSESYGLTPCATSA